MAPATLFTTLHFLCQLRMGAISQSVTLHQARKACQRQAFQLIVPICKLRRKKFYEYGPRDCIGSPSFSFHLLMVVISQSVTFQYAGMACKGQALRLIWLVHKLRRTKCEYGSSNFIHNTPFSLLVTNGCNKLITLGQKGLPATNTLAYQPIVKFCKGNSRFFV